MVRPARWSVTQSAPGAPLRISCQRLRAALRVRLRRSNFAPLDSAFLIGAVTFSGKVEKWIRWHSLCGKADAQTAVADSESTMTDLEPAMTERKSAMNDLEPAMTDLESVMTDWAPIVAKNRKSRSLAGKMAFLQIGRASCRERV